MKKYMNIGSASLNLIIVFSALFLEIWSYASGGYGNLYSWRWGTISTIQLFDKGMYNDEILIFSLVLSFIALIASSVLIFQKKKISLARKVQIVASIIIVLMFALVHFGIFEFYADYSICELNTIGFIVVGLCVINTVLSIVFIKKQEQ